MDSFFNLIFSFLTLAFNNGFIHLFLMVLLLTILFSLFHILINL